jgi:uncharacterized protein (TIGR02466 family)
MNNLNFVEVFKTLIFFEQKKEWVNNLNNFSEEYIKLAKIEQQNILKEKHIKFNKNIGDHGHIYHSNTLVNDINFKEFIDYIFLKSFNILNETGYDLNNYNLKLNEIWVQEFAVDGGGYHEGHLHSNNHICGFYFLKCSNKTSYPIFHDPRESKLMMDLPLKDKTKLTHGNNKVHFNPEPGTLILFPGYLKHEFVLDHGIEPFRFIHFNIQAFPKELLNK